MAQLTVDAGINDHICKGISVTLGGHPTVTGANPPFTYHWYPNIHLSSDTVANPIATAYTTTTFYVTVTDSLLNTATDSVTVGVTNKYNLHITASDTDICKGQPVSLIGNATTLATTCNANILAPVIGDDSITQVGSALQPPTLFGNYVHSYKNQMLYTASELQAALGGPCLIKKITFRLNIFNSAGLIENFSIKATLTSVDSLTDWVTNLTEVFPSSVIQPNAVFNGFILTTPIYWDGFSNLLIDVCNYSPISMGSQNNKERCSPTPVSGYLYSSGNVDQCAGVGTPIKSYLRPNIQFNYCVPTTNPVPSSDITFNWFSSSGTQEVSNIHSPSPTAAPDESVTYFLHIEDSLGCIESDSINIHVANKYNLHITASDTDICAGEVIQLNSTSSSLFLTASCNTNNLTPIIGNDDIPQPGSALQPPTLFGNFLKSNRNQMLYKASELQAVLGGPKLIRAITFGVNVFNSNAFLQNFTIRIGWTSVDSLIDWNENLVQVYSSSSPYQPQAGWLNGIALTTPIYWDGTSNMVVDICHYNPATFGNQNNKASCSQTPFASYLYSGGYGNQCVNQTTPVKYYLRPNIRLNYCTPTTTPAPIPPGGVSFNWGSTSTTQSVSNIHSPNPTASPDSTVIYELRISDSYGCVESDSVFIHVTPRASSASISVFDKFCSNLAEGEIHVVLTSSTDSVHYSLLNSNFSNTLFTGVGTNNSIHAFQNLNTGTYHLLISDSVCSNMDYPIVVPSFPAIIFSSPTVSNIYCIGDSTGSACINVSGGVPPYLYLWDSLDYRGACYDSLKAGAHYVTVIDSNNCSAISPFSITSNYNPITLYIIHDSAVTSAYHIIAIINGGVILPYSIDWGDSTQTISNNGYAEHFYYSDSIFHILIHDGYGCSMQDTLVVIYNSIDHVDLSGTFFQLQPNPANDFIRIAVNDDLIGGQLIITDVTGRKITLAQLQSEITTLQTTNFSNGVYFATISHEGKTFTRKLVIEK